MVGSCALVGGPLTLQAWYHTNGLSHFREEVQISCLALNNHENSQQTIRPGSPDWLFHSAEMVNWPSALCFPSSFSLFSHCVAFLVYLCNTLCELQNDPSSLISLGRFRNHPHPCLTPYMTQLSALSLSVGK